MRASMGGLLVFGLILALVASQGGRHTALCFTSQNDDSLPAGVVARLQHNGVRAIAYSADGKRLLSAGMDETIRVWDTAKHKELQTIKTGHGVLCVALVPAGSGKPEGLAITASAVDRNVCFWDLKVGKQRDDPIDNPDYPAVVATSPDGKLLATGSQYRSEIFLWRVADGKEVRRWRAHAAVTSLAFAPDGKTIASGGWTRSPTKKGDKTPADDYGVAIWKTDTGEAVHKLAWHKFYARAIAFSGDGELLVSCGAETKEKHSAVLWDAKQGKKLHDLKSTPDLSDVRSVAVSKDGKKVAVAAGHRVHLWQTEKGAELPSLSGTKDDRLVAIAFAPDGQTLAAAGELGRITLWDLAQRQPREPRLPAKP